LSDIPIQGKMLIAAVGPRWCRHCEEMIYTCTYSEMRILQLIVSGTLANAGRPERVINKTKHTIAMWCLRPCFSIATVATVTFYDI
jgi:hypothetical protein